MLCKRHPLTLREVGQEPGPAPHLYRPSVPFDMALRRHIQRFLDDFVSSEPVELRAVVEMVMDRLVPVNG